MTEVKNIATLPSACYNYRQFAIVTHFDILIFCVFCCSFLGNISFLATFKYPFINSFQCAAQRVLMCKLRADGPLEVFASIIVLLKIVTRVFLAILFLTCKRYPAY